MPESIMSLSGFKLLETPPDFLGAIRERGKLRVGECYVMKCVKPEPRSCSDISFIFMGDIDGRFFGIDKGRRSYGDFGIRPYLDSQGREEGWHPWHYTVAADDPAASE